MHVIKVLLLSALLLFSLSIWSQPDTIRIGTFPPEGKMDAIIISIVKFAYDKMGIKAEIIHMPGARTIVEANKGAVDAELFRIAGMETKFPNLVQIPEPIFETHIVAATLNPNIQANTWEKLKPYQLAFVRGFKLAESNTKGMGVKKTSTLMQAVQLLVKNKIDIIIDSELNLLQEKYKNTQHLIRLISPPLESIQLFHYLNKKHSHMVAPLSNIIQSMRNNGDLAMIIRQHQTLK